MYNFNEWNQNMQLNTTNFTCWNCNNIVGSNIGFTDIHNENIIYICPYCKAPNIFIEENPIFKPLIGRDIEKLPEEINNLYNEIRKCIQVEAYTGAVMLLRKILMNVAVKEGDKEGKYFKEYVEYLVKKNIIHKKQHKLVDKVRDIGNNANHYIEQISKEDAMNLFKLIEHLLLSNYEFADEEE